MSTVFYKFASQNAESRVTFDGTHISVFDLKKEIMLGNKMGSGKDFELGVFDAATGEELKDDHHQIARSSSVTVRRLPPSSKPGARNASRYIAGTSMAVGGRDDMVDKRVEAGSRDALAAKRTGFAVAGRPGVGHITKRFDGKEEPGQEDKIVPPAGSAEEEARLAAMFSEQNHQWEAAQDALSHQTRVSYDGRGRGGGGVGRGGSTRGGGSTMSAANYHFMMDPNKPPPPGYICYRCGQKGHWIQACPTNENPDWENKPRFKRTTGIPKSFLKAVEQPATGEGAQQGVMITSDGSFVMVQPDTQTWKQTTKARALTEADIRDGATADGELSCPICSRLLRDAVRTPCCKTAYCEECIQNALLDQDFVCPKCESKIASLEKLRPDEELRQKVDEFVKAEVEKNREAQAAALKEEEAEIEASDAVKTEGGSETGSPSTRPAIVKQDPENEAKPAISQEDGEIEDDGRAAQRQQQPATGSDSQQLATNNPPAAMSQPDMMAQMMAMNLAMNPMLSMQMQTLQQQITRITHQLGDHKLTPPSRMQLQSQLQTLQSQLEQTQMMAMGIPPGMVGAMQSFQNGMAQQQQNGMMMGQGYQQQHGMGMGQGMRGQPGRGRGGAGGFGPMRHQGSHVPTGPYGRPFAPRGQPFRGGPRGGFARQ